MLNEKKKNNNNINNNNHNNNNGNNFIFYSEANHISRWSCALYKSHKTTKYKQYVQKQINRIQKTLLSTLKLDLIKELVN